MYIDLETNLEIKNLYSFNLQTYTKAVIISQVVTIKLRLRITAEEKECLKHSASQF
jgi:hypothetical protein